MKLTELGFETADVLVRKARGVEGEEGYQPARYLTVRGFSADDMMRLVKIHSPALVFMFNELMNKNDGKFDLADTASLVRLAYQQSPAILGDIIQIASDADDPTAAFEIAVRLPIAVQFAIIEKVADLTFVEHGNLGEFMGTVVKMFGGIDGLAQSLKASVSGLLASERALALSEATATQKRPAGH